VVVGVVEQALLGGQEILVQRDQIRFFQLLPLMEVVVAHLITPMTVLMVDQVAALLVVI
jgi:hypothetical protein